MIKANKIVFLSYFLVIFSFFILTSSVFAFTPQLQFNNLSYSSGSINFTGDISSGTIVELDINNKFIAKQTIFPYSTNINLTSILPKIVVGINGVINFKNINPNQHTYALNFTTSKVFSILQPNTSFKFTQTQNLGSFSYFDENSAMPSSTIIVKDILNKFIFKNVEFFLNNGKNNISFKIFNLDSKFLYRKNFTIIYKKYSNQITILKYKNLTAKTSVRVSGKVSDNSSILYYVVNPTNPIINSGVLNQVKLNGSKFNLTVYDLSSKINEISFVSLKTPISKIFNGRINFNVVVNATPPFLEIKQISYSKDSGQEINFSNQQLNSGLFLSKNTLKFNVSTDGVNLTVNINNKNTTYKVFNDSVSFSLSLVKGENNLTLISTSETGVINKVAHQIHFDNTAISISDITPSSGTVHFFLQNFKGKVNKPNVQITVFTIPQNAEINKVSSGGTTISQSVTCSDYKYLAVRNLGAQYQMNYPGNPNIITPAMQTSLTSLIASKVTTTSDSSGNFIARNVILQSNNMMVQPNLNSNSNQHKIIQSQKSLNTVCFILNDKYGNIQIATSNIILDDGNTLWKAAEITTVPNTLYSYEIAGSSDTNSVNGNTQFGVIARFKYLGSGRVSTISSFNVQIDPTVNSKYDNYFSIVGSPDYNYNKNTHQMIVYFQVKVSPFSSISPMNYPSQVKLNFMANMIYTLEQVNVPVDNTNPIYFQTSINIENPLDHTKWLTPSTINKTINFLNNSIKFTQKAVSVLGYATEIGVLACTADKFWTSFKIKSIKSNKNLVPSEKTTQINKAKEDLYYVCDRVYCSSAPNSCSSGIGGNVFKTNKAQVFSGNSILAKAGTTFTSTQNNKNILGRVNNLQILSGSNACITPTNKPGVLVNMGVTQYIQSSVNKYRSSGTSTQYITNACVAIKSSKSFSIKNIRDGKIKEISPTQINSLDLQSYSGVCYTPNAPNFDKTRTLSKPGWDPASNIIESIGSACVTDTYSHLNNWLKVQKAIKQCLEQAKIGKTQGSYCERLMGISVCDIATNILFKSPGLFGARKSTNGKNPHGGNTGGILSSFGTGQIDTALNERYSNNNFYNQIGFSTADIANKVCLASLTGDWSALTDTILTSANQNQIDPTFGPPFATSRMSGFNPLTGKLTVQYRFTYAIVSGGQQINTKVEFICNPNKPNGKFCPQNRVSSTQVGSSFSVPILYVNKGGTADKTIVVTDENARFMYNVLKLTNVYSINGKQKEISNFYNIDPLSHGLLVGCYFTGGILGAGAGFSCKALFNGNSLISYYSINRQTTNLIPKQPTLYPSNSLLINLGFNVKTGKSSQDSFDLGYLLSCPNQKGGISKTVGYKTIIPTSNSQNQFVNLYQLPKIIGGIKISSFNYFTSPNIFKKTKNRFPTIILHISSSQNTLHSVSFILEKNNVQYLNKKGTNTLGQVFTIPRLSTKFTELTILINSSNPKFKFSSIYSKSLNIYYTIGNTKTKIYLTSTNQQLDNQFTNLAPGECNLYLKILPINKGSSITIPTFFKNNGLNSNSQITNVQQNKILNLSFILQDPSKAKQNNLIFGIVSPKQSQTICLDPESINLTLAYVAQTVSQNTGYVFNNIKASINQFQNIFTPSKSLAVKIFTSNKKIPNKFNFKFTPGAIPYGLYNSQITYKIQQNSVIIVQPQTINFKISYQKNCINTSNLS